MPAWQKYLFFFLIFLFIFSLFKAKTWGMELSLSNIPSEIEIEKEFSVHFYYKTTAKNEKYYLRPCFYLPGSSNYFGCIKNNQGNWVCGSQSEKTNYFEIEINEEGIWEGDLSLKADSGNGDYQLKIRRYTAGGSSVDSNSLPIKISSPLPSETLMPVPSPTVLPTATLTPTLLSSATYKINEVKDESSEFLSSVKIYLDGVYLHHYAPETLTFCDGCQCDGVVVCGFGEHLIKLEKSGFADWEEKRLIEAGKSYQVDPVMKEVALLMPTATSKPSPYYSPTVFKKETEALRLTPTKILETEVLASEEAKMDKGATLAGLVLGEGNMSDEVKKEEEEKPRKDYIGYFLIGGGGLLLLAAGWPLVKKILKARSC